MDSIKLEAVITILTNDEVTDEDAHLVESAKKISKSAYAPYSNFQVGASILLENGSQVDGSNQENAAYPSGLCAERVAVFSAASNYPGKTIKTIAVYANGSNDPVAPCGACRQVIFEYEQKQKSTIRILLTNDSEKIFQINSVSDIFPMGFKGEGLK
ncbi:MAG: cytidine deaminase [Bacteroidetes bacterium]|nr:cytidine deaminase [Bacteroidota bacterium]